MMKPNRAILMIGLILLLMTTSCNGSNKKDPANQTSPLLEFLSNIPDNDLYRQWVSYGDLSTWFEVWNIERPEAGNLENLKSSDFNSPLTTALVLDRQTFIPQSFNQRYALIEDQIELLGFNFIVLDRYMEAGTLPYSLTIAEFGFDKSQIEDALVRSGYKSRKISNKTFYSLHEDYEADLESPSNTLRASDLNRILLSDGKMVIGRATEVIVTSLDAYSGNIPSLAENVTFVALAQVLDGEAQGDLGKMVGIIMINGATIQNRISQRLQETTIEQSENYFQNPLPEFDLAGFATFQSGKTTFLTLVLVFPAGLDVHNADETLAERLQNYTNTAIDEPYSKRWSVEKTSNLTINELPVVIVSMRAEGIEVQSVFGNTLNVLTWRPLIDRQDFLFLKTDP